MGFKLDGASALLSVLLAVVVEVLSKGIGGGSSSSVALECRLAGELSLLASRTELVVVEVSSKEIGGGPLSSVALEFRVAGGLSFLAFRTNFQDLKSLTVSRVVSDLAWS